MHDLLRDMGREIVNKESPKEPGKRSRLWSSEDIYNVLKKQKGTEAIEGIIIPYERKEVTLNTKTFEKMNKLRLLGINDVHLTGNFEHIFEELRWLSWQRCDLQCLPSDFHPEKLVILDLQFSKINILWHGILRLEQLKILNLDGCEFLKTTPDFTGVPNLEELHLRDCTSLVEIHSSIGHLSKLASLALSDCTAITKLPDSIGRLSRLRYLNLSSCSNLRTLPSSLCNLRVLEFLHLYNCYNLEELPEELRNIESLRVLRLSCCWNLKNLKNIPSSIWKLPLRKLDFQSCKISNGNLSDIIGSLSSLERLDLSSCEISDGNLLDNIGSLSSLKELRLESNSFSTLPFSLGQLSNLEDLDLANCSRLVEIQGLEKLTSIRNIELQGCNNLAIAFTETFFQVYSGFGKEIDICLPTRDCPGWVGHQIKGTTICFDVPQNSENKFLGMILWLVPETELPWAWVFVENKTNGQRADGRCLRPYGKGCYSAVMFIPKTVFAVKFGDKIEASIRSGQKLIIERFGVHLVYKTDSSSIENY